VKGHHLPAFELFIMSGCSIGVHRALSFAAARLEIILQPYKHRRAAGTTSLAASAIVVDR